MNTKVAELAQRIHMLEEELEVELASARVRFHYYVQQGRVRFEEGVAAEHLQRGLEQAITVEGLRRLRSLSCTRVFSIASDETTNSLYRSVMQTCRAAYPWVKIWIPNEG